MGKNKISNGANKKIIENNFSKYARFYDSYSTIQNFSAQELINQISSNGFKNILDIGCGTGNFTRLLKNKFPQAKITAIDLSKEMLNIAKEKLTGRTIKFLHADGERFKTGNKFDLISSNATFQWFQGLDKDLKRYQQLLKKAGLILFSTFGPLTFYELHEALQNPREESFSISASEFIGKEKLELMLKGLFKAAQVRQHIYTEKYDSLGDLLKKIKYTGTRGNSKIGKGFWTAKKISEIEKRYLKKFGRIMATYQVFLCKGRK